VFGGEIMKRQFGQLVKTLLTVSALAVTLPLISVAAPIVFSAVDAIQTEVDDFRAALGNPNNGNNPGPLAGGRREINWDGGGSTATSPAPNPFPGFQLTRGALFATPGSGFVQAPPDGLATTFTNPTYTTFQTFSPVRLFSAVGSNITDATFTVPGSLNPATVTGFGVVFSDVDLAGSATLQFYDLDDNPIGDAFTAQPFNNGLSFLGVIFDAGEIVGRVRIMSGSVAPGPNDGPNSDVVMMDDFLYAEPAAGPAAVIPEPASMFLFGTGLSAIALKLRKRG
jgi:PEP-CTERM motif